MKSRLIDETYEVYQPEGQTMNRLFSFISVKHVYLTGIACRIFIKRWIANYVFYLLRSIFVAAESGFQTA